MQKRSIRRALAAVGLLAVLTSAAACGADDEPSGVTRNSAEPNQADVDFATDMIQHHAQALSMVDLTRGREIDDAFGKLVEGIQDAQAPEIETMTAWLTAWGEEVPATMRDHVNSGHGAEPGAGMEGTDHEMAEMPGMMTAEQMQALGDASDAEFEELWITMMIEHHEGAVAMAQAEVDGGSYGPARELAQAIIDGQQREIDEMRAMLE